MPSKADLTALLAHLDGAPVECDGMVRLLTTVLQKAGVAHQVMFGQIQHGDQRFAPHYWIDVDDLRIDYRARMWIRADNVPHGVFDPTEYATSYEGMPVTMDPLPDAIFTILSSIFVDKIEP